MKYNKINVVKTGAVVPWILSDYTTLQPGIVKNNDVQFMELPVLKTIFRLHSIRCWRSMALIWIAIYDPLLRRRGMKIAIINGNPRDDDQAFDGYMETLAASLEDLDHDVTIHELRGMQIIPCRGCFDCWVKTPGMCRFKDDTVDLCKSYISSDFVIMASPMIMGYTSALLKNAMDRLIPLIHPHLRDESGEVHHLPRYDSYPVMGLLLSPEPSTDKEDVEIVTDIYRRACINVMSELKFVEFSEKPAREVANAINNN